MNWRKWWEGSLFFNLLPQNTWLRQRLFTMALVSRNFLSTTFGLSLNRCYVVYQPECILISWWSTLVCVLKNLLADRLATSARLHVKFFQCMVATCLHHCDPWLSALSVEFLFITLKRVQNAAHIRVAKVQFRTDTKNQNQQNRTDGSVLLWFGLATDSGSGSQFGTLGRQGELGLDQFELNFCDQFSKKL